MIYHFKEIYKKNIIKICLFILKKYGYFDLLNKKLNEVEEINTIIREYKKRK